MTPVLPAFAGGVPEAIRRLYPEAKFTRHGNWGGFDQTHCCVLMVSPVKTGKSTIISNLLLNPAFYGPSSQISGPIAHRLTIRLHFGLNSRLWKSGFA